MLNDIMVDIHPHSLGKVDVIKVIKAILINRSVQRLISYRLARHIMALPFIGGVLSELITYFSRLLFPCELSINASICPGVDFPHPVGIVIGEGVIIRRHCSIYQNVTLGRKTILNPSYPTINEGVVIYSGAVVVGSITVGKNNIIGASSVLMSDVVESDIVAGIPAISVEIK